MSLSTIADRRYNSTVSEWGASYVYASCPTGVTVQQPCSSRHLSKLPILASPPSRGRRRNSDHHWPSTIPYTVNTIRLPLSGPDATVKGLMGRCLHTPHELSRYQATTACFRAHFRLINEDSRLLHGAHDSPKSLSGGIIYARMRHAVCNSALPPIVSLFPMLSRL
jgi:hypothetical protein